MNGRKLKTGGYGRHLVRHHCKKTYHIHKTRGHVKYTYVDAGWLEVSHSGTLHVVCFAYAFLTHVAIRSEGAQGKRKAAVRLSSLELQNEVRRIDWEDLTAHLKQLFNGTQIVKELERLLIAT